MTETPIFHTEPSASEGEDIAWTADPDEHLSHAEPFVPAEQPASGPLPVCDYTGDEDEPCEEPAVQRRWSGAAVVTAATLGAMVGAAFAAAALVWALGLLPGSRPLKQPEVRAQPPQVRITSTSITSDVSEAVARKVVPSVVNVKIQQAMTDPFTGARRFVVAGNGSGVIVRSDGYILTNNHVVEDAARIVVTVGVKDTTATVVGTDPSSDVAVLKVGGGPYPAAELGSSAELRVGQYVMAVGSPFGLDKTVTVGIVSALNRSEMVNGQEALTTYTNLIQTDAAINPGNSGGALVDDEGRLVGLNTLIQSPSGQVGAPQSAGIGFAIPIDFAMDIARQLISKGSATHPYMGVSTASIDEATAQQFGLPVVSGAQVQFVQPGSPADRAGLKRGDIIVRIGDVDITKVEDVFSALRAHKIGDRVAVTVARGETEVTLDVTLGSDATRR